MAFFSHALSNDTTVARGEKPSLFVRLIASMMEARQRQAEREISRYIALNGGKITDSIELEIERRFLTGRRSF